MCLIGAVAPFEGSPPTAHAGQTPTGTVTVGINAQPSMRTWRYNGPNPDSWWCAPPNCYQNPNPQVSIDGELNLARQLGVKIPRQEFPWALIEPGRGVFDWSRADLIVGEAAKYGIPLQPVLVFTPSWPNSGGPTYPPAASDFQSFAQAIAARYSSIHYWEMWNEPNYGFNGGGYWWPGVEQDYVRDVLCPGYNGVKAGNPSASVLLGGPSSPDLGWLGNIYTDGGGNCFDIMAFHGYGSPENDSPGVYNLLVAHGQANKPIWVGEFGAQEQGTSDPNQTSLLNAVYTSHAHIAVAEWYNLRDDFSMTCCPMAVHTAAYWGLVQHDDATVKSPGFATYQQLAGGTPTPPPPSKPTISSFSPMSGPVGTAVTVRGSGFMGAARVTFNGTSAGYTVSSDSVITAGVPSGATSGPIAVTTYAGTGTSSSNFMVSGAPPPPPPSITGFSPTSGGVGTTVAIDGTNFSGASSVTFNGTPATFTVTSDTRMSSPVPPGATSGRISVIAPGGTATSSASFTVTVPPPPSSCPYGWSCQDIGNPAVSGGQSVSTNGVWTVSGSGTGIQRAADQFHFIARVLSGDGTVTADLASFANAGERSMSGIMVRSGAGAGAARYSVVITGHGVLTVVYRATTGGSTVTLVAAPGNVPPRDLRIVRSGVAYSAQTSTDGVTWTPVNGSSVSIQALLGSPLAGVAVSSGSSSQVTSANMDHVAVTLAGVAQR